MISAYLKATYLEAEFAGIKHPFITSTSQIECCGGGSDADKHLISCETSQHLIHFLINSTSTLDESHARARPSYLKSSSVVDDSERRRIGCVVRCPGVCISIPSWRWVLAESGTNGGIEDLGIYLQIMTQILHQDFACKSSNVSRVKSQLFLFVSDTHN